MGDTLFDGIWWIIGGLAMFWMFSERPICDEIKRNFPPIVLSQYERKPHSVTGIWKPCISALRSIAPILFSVKTDEMAAKSKNAPKARKRRKRDIFAIFNHLSLCFWVPFHRITIQNASVGLNIVVGRIFNDVLHCRTVVLSKTRRTPCKHRR